MMSAKLKPCPRCGSNRVKYETMFDFKCRLYCPVCEYATRWYLQGVEEAIAEWNASKTDSEK